MKYVHHSCSSEILYWQSLIMKDLPLVARVRRLRTKLVEKQLTGEPRQQKILVCLYHLVHRRSADCLHLHPNSVYNQHSTKTKGPFTHTLHWAALSCAALGCAALVLVELVETEKCFY